MTTDAGHLLLSHLSFLADSEEWQALAGLLLKPLEFRKCRLAAVDTPIEDLLLNLDRRLADFGELRSLFHIALLSAHLRFPEECPPAVVSFLAERDIRDVLLPGISMAGPPPGRWVAAAVLVALGEEAQLRYFVVGEAYGNGRLVRMPPWAEPLLDDSAKEAIFDAAEAAIRLSYMHRPDGFICFPLCIPNRTVQIRGRSLGLPLGMAFAGLLSAEKPARVIAATGDLAPGGTVRKVGGLDPKSVCLTVNPRRFKALLFPAENGAPFSCDGLELLPVATLEDARMFSALYAPGKADRLIQLPAMLKDPQRFVEAFRTLDPAWIRWAVARGKLADVAEQIAVSQDLFEGLLARLEESLKSRDLDLSSAISSLISPSHFQSSAAAAPKAAFKWCTQNIALANHTGNIAASADWIRMSEPLVLQIQSVEPEAVADHFNHRLVSQHNRYRFSPEVPPQLEKPLAFLENQLAVKKQAGSPVEITLGRLYGTLGQQFAFCGPAYLEAALGYFEKGRSALGEGTVPDLKLEWMRQINYEAFAYLDAGRFEEARQRVCAYLEVTGLREVRPEAVTPELPWKHNLLARFLVDTMQEGLARQYLSWAGNRSFAPYKPDHPWQLWAFNVGRIAFALGETEGAVASFRMSLDLCLKAKPTIRVMALLGLSGLARLNALPPSCAEIEAELRLTAAELNADHFVDLFQVPFAQLLEQVWADPGRMFPFTYH